jgi:hypothetical protein
MKERGPGLKEKGVIAATKVCRYNTSNYKDPVEDWWREQIGENQCLAHLADGRILDCQVRTQRQLARCADFETHKGRWINPEKRNLLFFRP